MNKNSLKNLELGRKKGIKKPGELHGIQFKKGQTPWNKGKKFYGKAN